MSLIFLEGFDDGGSANKWNTWLATTVSSSYGRNGLGCRISGNSSTQLGRSLPSNGTYIIGAALQQPQGGLSTFNTLSFYEGATLHVAMRFDTSTGTINVYRSTTLIDSSSSGLISNGEWHYYEVKVTIHDSTGVFQVDLDGTQVINFSGDTRNGGTSGVIDVIYFGCNSGNHLYMDDIYVFDDAGSTNNAVVGDCVVETIKPNGNGNYSDFTGSDGNSVDNYLLVDDAPTPDSDSTYVAAGIAGDTDTYAMSDLSAVTSATVFGVQVGTLARHEGAGGTYRHAHRRGTTDSFGSAKTPGASYGWDAYVWEQDPAAGPGAWTVANVNASEFGVDIVS